MATPENAEKIISDLPNVQKVALSPWASNPLLALVLQQAQALQQIATWAASAHELAHAAQPAPVEASTDAPEGIRLVGEAG